MVSITKTIRKKASETDITKFTNTRGRAIKNVYLNSYISGLAN